MKRWRGGEVDCRVRQAAGGAPRDAKWSCLFKDLQFYFWILSCVSIREPGERGAGGSPRLDCDSDVRGYSTVCTRPFTEVRAAYCIYFTGLSFRATYSSHIGCIADIVFCPGGQQASEKACEG